LVGALHDADEAMVIVDCLTLWVSNLMWRDRTDVEIHEAAERTADVARRRGAPTVVVSNEVGLGIHPETELGRRYRDTLGRVNQVWARAADTSLLLVAGRALPLVDPDVLL
ncbi:MAG: bifunctional adenosylcobinamide kinase/adenosylcobinamide-phosphate guanylyltransferase, partial [Actinomycetota bacterium]